VSLQADVNTIRNEILESAVSAWNLTKAHFGRPRTENTDADLPRGVVRLARMVPNGATSTVSTISWRALFEITLVDRVPRGAEEVEALKIEKAQALRNALMTSSAIAGIGILPTIEGYEFDEEAEAGKVWWYSVNVVFSCLIEESALS